jgi:hypothetical protein
MELTPEQIKNNWDKLLDIISKHISSPRKEKLIELYTTYDERISLMPASYKKEFHNCFPGGYVDHVIRVFECAHELHHLWGKMGSNTSSYDLEELSFSAINHDLGKIGDENHESYIPQDNEWRRKTLGETYKFNGALQFASVPDRSLYILQANGIQYSINEMIAIQTHDGLYDEGNKKYLLGFTPEQKPRNPLPFILHQADLMASRIEFERVWGSILNPQENNVEGANKDNKLPPSNRKTPTKDKALKGIKSDGLKNMLDKI